MTKSLYEAFRERVVATGSDPGTIYTASVETIDNDVVLQELAVLSDSERPGPTPHPRPQPGTTLTATVETTDEDASNSLDHLR